MSNISFITTLIFFFVVILLPIINFIINHKIKKIEKEFKDGEDRKLNRFKTIFELVYRAQKDLYTLTNEKQYKKELETSYDCIKNLLKQVLEDNSKC